MLNVALAIAALPVAVQVMDGRASLAAVSEAYYESPSAVHDVAVNGEPVQNLYPYSRDGKLLLDVLLFDDMGRAVEVGSADPKQDPLRRYLFTKGGQPVLNSFPIRYVEPGSTKVEDPTAAPAEVQIPKIATPPLKRP